MLPTVRMCGGPRVVPFLMCWNVTANVPYIASFWNGLRLYMHIPDGGNKMPTIVAEIQERVSERHEAVAELPVMSGCCGGTSCSCDDTSCCCDDTSCCGDGVSSNVSGALTTYAA